MVVEVFFFFSQAADDLLEGTTTRYVVHVGARGLSPAIMGTRYRRIWGTEQDRAGQNRMNEIRCIRSGQIRTRAKRTIIMFIFILTVVFF